MGINFAPKWHGLPGSEEDVPQEDDFDFFTPEAEHAGDSRLASGWWILPFAAAGSIECYFAIDWLFARL